MQRRRATKRAVKGQRAKISKARKLSVAVTSSDDRQKELIKRLRRERDQALRLQAASAEVLKVIGSSRDGELTSVFEAMLANALRICEAKFGHILLYDGECFHAAHLHDVPASYRAFWEEHGPIRPNPNTGLGLLVRTKQIAHIPDLKAHSAYAQREPLRIVTVDQAGARSFLSVPMLKENKLIGAIVIYRQEVRPFTEKQIGLVKNFADQAVIAIENARLFNETREALERQTATADILKVIATSPDDVQPVFQAIADRSNRLVDALSTTVFRLVDGTMYLRAFTPTTPEADATLQATFPAPLSTFSWGESIGKGEIYRVIDAEQEPERLRDLARKRGWRSCLCVPLMRDGKPIGMIGPTRAEPGPFADHHVQLMQTFADQAVIAIENTRLFNQVQAKTRDLEESLQQQTATADVLKVISRSVFDLEAVLKALVGSAVELTGAFSGAICIRDGETFRYRAGAGPGYSEKLQRYLESTPVFPGRGSIPGRVLLSGKIEEIPDVLEDSEYKIPLASLGLPARALLGVPLLGRQGIEGSLTLVRRDPGRFAPRIIELVQTFADQAVIAIENARLFEEVQARTRELSESLQQQTATADVLEVISRSAFDLQTVFNTVAESAVRLCGADRAFIFRFDGELLRMVVAYNASAEFTEFVRQNPIRPGRHSGSARAALERRTVQIVDVRDDAEYSYGAKQVEPIRTLLGVPILKGDELFGVMMIYRLEVRAFTERQIALVETFANQAAIAIENVRLFEAEQRRTIELAKSLDDLRSAQDRLIQTEKLASLGQLTAGIAHEIKNPLNFVNNFSALSTELTDELNDILKSAALGEKMRAEVDELTRLLKDNLEKVVQHGKRADSIVKNMLLHSREGSRERRFADINTLVGESLNLAYHGARAEKAGFSITLKHDLDPEAGAVDLYPQEITRALLNLISNGFYAATRRKVETLDDTFEPVLSAATRNLGKTIEIRIRDNGTGIAPEVREKIFNPFFTTKPTGEGTGLGLSMTHDIIVKQHGGRIDVETEPGAFTEFIITLPRDNGAALGQKPE
jgi:two-component system, NtrC family, sensor kinase